MNNEQIKNGAFNGAMWNLATNIGTQLASFIIQVILARLLEPSAYGTIALVTFFIAVANVFVTTGYSSALIQKDEVTQEDCSTSFYIGLIISVILYLVLFISSPLVATFYNEPILINILRIQSLTLIFGSLTSVHYSLINRHLQFRKFFVINLSGIVAQGFVGILLALKGFGVWALVYSYLSNKVVVLIITWKVESWRPQKVFSWDAFRGLFSFSSKVLAFTLVDTIFSNIKLLIIGKKYSTEMLAYYNRGNQIPDLVATNGIGAIGNVLFPALSRCNNDFDLFKSAYRRAFKIMFYISFPIYLGLVAVAPSLTLVLLTDKWYDSILFMQLVSLTLIFNPFFVRCHVYNAMGRSDISMWLSFLDKVVITIFLVLALKYGDVYTLVIISLFTNMISVLFGIIINMKVLKYTLIEQIYDFGMNLLQAIFMFIPVYLINFMNILSIYKLLLQVIVGCGFYLLISIIMKNDSMIFILNILKTQFMSEREK